MDAKKTQLVKEIAKECNEGILFLEDEFDIALVGTGFYYGSNIVAVYDVGECIKVLVDKHGMGELEALDHFHNNMEGKWNKNKPVYINDFRKIKEIDDSLIDSLSSDDPISDVMSKFPK